MESKYSPEKLLRKILELDAVEFLGICKIIGVEVYNQDTKLDKIEDNVVTDDEADAECGRAIGHVNVEIEPRDFYDIWNDVVDTIGDMNRTRRRNLGKLIYPATKKEK